MKNKYILITLVILTGILFLLISSFVGDVRRLRRNDTPIQHNIDFIGGWMTFNYLSRSYNIPSDYLKTKLNINDQAYPNITISKAGREQGVPADVFVGTVKNTVSTYLAQNLPSQ